MYCGAINIGNRRINALRCELAKVRKRREESEKRIRLEAYETSDIQKALEELKEDTKVASGLGIYTDVILHSLFFFFPHADHYRCQQRVGG